MRSLRRESGFTLPELMVSLVMTMIVALATFTLIEVVMRKSGEVQARVQATQKGRLALEVITQQLRSQVCLNTANPVPPMSPPTGFGVGTDDNTAVFYVDFSNAATTTSAPGAVGIDPKDTAPELHVLSYESAAKRIVERDYRVTAATTANGANTYTYPTFATTPARFKVLLNNVVPYRAPLAVADTPIFTYYKYNSPAPPTLPTPTFVLTPGVGGLSVADTAVIAKIAIAYRAQSDIAKGASTVFQDDVYVRAADPNDEAPTPTCA